MYDQPGETSIKSIMRTNGVKSSLSGRQLNVTLHESKSVRSGSLKASHIVGDNPTSEQTQEQVLAEDIEEDQESNDPIVLQRIGSTVGSESSQERPKLTALEKEALRNK